MSTDVGTLGTIYHCEIDGDTYKITSSDAAVRVTDPASIAAAQNQFISNWRQFHLEGSPDGGPAGGNPPPISAYVVSPPSTDMSYSPSPVTDGYVDGSGEQNMREAKNRLMAQYQLTSDQASAFIGNWLHESGGRADINQGGELGGPNGDMSGSGYGFAQWTGSRKQQLLQFSSDHGLDPSKFDTQWQYLQTEPEFKQVVQDVKGTNSLEEATSTVELGLEGIPLDYDPNVLAMDSRLHFARQATAY